ncbi:MAG: hypothetical protein HY275_10715 [Gemmatimonadetes bacterium]|nr:hypothetical protein [Gemmatimonadota bacterium]
MSRPAWMGNVLLAIGGTLLPLVALEGALRVTNAAPAAIYEADTALIYRLRPGGEKVFVHRPSNGGGAVPVSINADGFRGPPLRTDGARRIIVYGDSFIEGEFVHDDSTFARDLEHLLAPGTPTEVLNAGVVGWGPDQAFVRMQQELPRLKPALVVLAIFADNDMGDIVRDRLFLLGPDSALVRHPVVLHPTLRRALEAQANPTGWRRLHLVRWIERKVGRASGALPVTRGRGPGPAFSLASYAPWALWNAQQQYAEMKAAPDTVLDLLGDSYDADIAATPDSASARYKVAIMDRLLGAIAADLTARRVPLVLVVIPSPIDMCETYDVRIDPRTYPQYDRRRISRTVDSLAARHQIRRVDLWDALRAQDPCTLFYRGGDLHWNARGQAIAARVVADSLAAWQLAR